MSFARKAFSTLGRTQRRKDRFIQLIRAYIDGEVETEDFARRYLDLYKELETITTGLLYPELSILFSAAEDYRPSGLMDAYNHPTADEVRAAAQRALRALEQ